MIFLDLYKEEIRKGDIKVCKKIKKAIKRIGKLEKKYTFDQEKANYAIDFVEKYCRHYEGKWAGKKIKLSLWQKVICEAVFGILNKDGLRVIREVFIVVGRKNGKSTFMAAIGLYMLIADGERGAKIYSVANKLDQAKIIYKAVRQMVFMSKSLKAITHNTRTGLEFGSSELEPLASDSKSLDGLNPHGGIYDEGHATKTLSLYEVIISAFGAREQPILWHITTAGFVRNGLYDELYRRSEKILDELVEDDSFMPFIYELDYIKEMQESNSWIKANPNINISISVKYLAGEIKKALENPRYKNGVATKHCNLPQSTSKAYYNLEDIRNDEKFNLDDMRGKYCIVGIDLSSTTDLTCVTFLFPFTGIDKQYIYQMYFLPEGRIDKKEEEDKKPYKTWVEAGYMLLSEGNSIDHEQVARFILDIIVKYELYVQAVGVDNWQISVIERKLKEAGLNVVSIRQGAQTLSSPMKQLVGDFKDNKIVHNNNPIFLWNTINVGVIADNNDNIRPVKANGRTERIDGFMSFLDAYVCYINLDEVLKNIFKDYQKNLGKEIEDGDKE